jgi:tetratricopeptide (TPR) repeat protein
VKGVAEPVAVSELVGPGRLHTRFDLSRARGLSRFVGRQEEMRQLEAALERARAGTAQIVGVVAEAGTGKSRLCYEFGERCRERGIELWSATCPPHGRSIPLSFNCAVVRAWLGVSELDSDEETRDRVAARMVRTDPELASLVPFVFDLLGVTERGHAPAQLNAEARQQRFLQLAERILIDGRDELLVALLDDVQWIDKTSEDAQVEIHRMQENTKTLTILNYRPEYRPSSVDRPNFTELRLHPLTAESTAELLADLLGPEAQGRGLEGAIQGRAGGNPFFVEEIVQELAESGHLEGVRGAYRLARPVTSLAVPDSVHAVLAARIDRLEEEPKRVLQAASVIGKSFGVTLLGYALSSEIDRLAPVLHELAEAEFVFQEAAYPEEVWRFKHPVTQEVAYQTLLRATRARMHAALAAALAERHVDRPDEHAALIAYHFERADEREQAARWHGRAAVWAGSNAPRDAIDHWERVRALLEDVEQSDEFVALAYAASTQLLWNGSRMGMDRERCLSLLEDAHRAVEQLGDERALFALHMLAFVSLAMLGEDPGTRAEQMLELASRSIDPWIRRAALLVAGRATIFRGDPAEGVRACEEALAMDELEPDLVGGVRLRGATDQELMMWKGMGELWLGRLDDAGATLERAVELAERANDLPYLATAHALAARAAALRQDVAGALRHAQRSVEIEERVGSRAGLYFAHSALMHALARAGRWEEARAEIDRIREILVSLGGGTNSFQLYFWGDQIEVLIACGESDAAREVAHAVLAAQLRLDDGTAGMLIPSPDAPIQAARALLRLDGAGASSAVARLLESAERSVAGGRRVFAPELALTRADQAAVEGDAVGAERWHRRAVVQLRELGLERRAAAVLAQYDL